jgi:hypothetical protein
VLDTLKNADLTGVDCACLFATLKNPKRLGKFIFVENQQIAIKKTRTD